MALVEAAAVTPRPATVASALTTSASELQSIKVERVEKDRKLNRTFILISNCNLVTYS